MTGPAVLLSRDNPRLLELEREYANLHLFDHSLWRTWADQIDIQRFRGENAYLAQLALGMTPERYMATYDHLVSLGEGETLARLGEDDAFGCVTFQKDGVTFSRDLLDSACELRFLRETLGLPWVGPHLIFTVMDIGAGYGRFGHRLYRYYRSQNVYVNCVDGVPLSTFLCDFYAMYRQDRPNVYSYPLTYVDSLAAVDLACNMYSFSEMPLSSVKFWLDRCADLDIQNFFLVPHAGDLVHPHFLTTEPDGTHQDYFHLFAEHGYQLIRQVPKFPIELTPSLTFSTDYLMFQRRSYGHP